MLEAAVTSPRTEGRPRTRPRLTQSPGPAALERAWHCPFRRCPSGGQSTPAPTPRSPGTQLPADEHGHLVVASGLPCQGLCPPVSALSCPHDHSGVQRRQRPHHGSSGNSGSRPCSFHLEVPASRSCGSPVSETGRWVSLTQSLRHRDPVSLSLCPDRSRVSGP